MMKKVEILTMYQEDHNKLKNMLESQGLSVLTYSFFTKANKVFLNKRELVFRELFCIIKGFLHLPKQYNKKIYCLSSNFSMLFFTRVFGGILGKEYHLYIYNFYLHAAEKNILMHLFLNFLLSSKKTTMIVQSPREVLFYKKYSNNEVFFVPYSWDINSIVESKSPLDVNSGYIFTGGYTNRDYSLVLKCAKLKPDWNFVIVISNLNKEFVNCDIPSNIILYKDISITSFNNLMKNSEIVLVPLKQDVGSSGQMLCLGAMYFSRPIVYCDVSSINYYFTNDSGLPYNINDLDTLINGISRFKENSVLKNNFGAKAYIQFMNNFTEIQRNEKICKIIVNDNNNK